MKTTLTKMVKTMNTIRNGKLSKENLCISYKTLLLLLFSFFLFTFVFRF